MKKDAPADASANVLKEVLSKFDVTECLLIGTGEGQCYVQTIGEMNDLIIRLQAAMREHNDLRRFILAQIKLLADVVGYSLAPEEEVQALEKQIRAYKPH